MMATTGLTIEIRLVWWWWPYAYTLMFVALAIGAEPDWEKFNKVLARAFRFRFAGARTWQSLA